MKTVEIIENKIAEIDQKISELEEEFQERLEDEEVEEFSDQGEDLRAEYDYKQKVLGKQIEILRWVLG